MFTAGHQGIRIRNFYTKSTENELIVAWCFHMASQILVIIGSGNATWKFLLQLNMCKILVIKS